MHAVVVFSGGMQMTWEPFETPGLQDCGSWFLFGQVAAWSQHRFLPGMLRFLRSARVVIQDFVRLGKCVFARLRSSVSQAVENDSNG